jgi:hypothetical protein
MSALKRSTFDIDDVLPTLVDLFDENMVHASLKRVTVGWMRDRRRLILKTQNGEFVSFGVDLYYKQSRLTRSVEWRRRVVFTCIQ